MAGRILVPLDGSPQAETALEHALSTFPDAEIVVLHVIDPIEAVYAAEGGGPLGGEKWYEDARERADEMLTAARERCERAGVTVTTETVVGRPARVIVEYAEDSDMDGIVMGTHGRSGISRAVLGSVAEAVVRRSPVPVTTVR